MNTIIKTTTASSHATSFDLSSPQLPNSTDCSPFLNWSEDKFDAKHERTVVFRSLVATLKIQPAFYLSLEAKAVKFLKSVILYQRSADKFLGLNASFSEESLMDFIQSIVVLISSPSKDITTASMEMFHYLIRRCSGSENFALVKADMIPQLLNILNPVSLSFADCQEIHTCLVYAIYISFWLATPGGLANLEIEDDDGQQAVHKIVLKKVFAPSETYICHLCKNHCSIIDGAQSAEFLTLLAYLLQRYPSCQHTMDIVLQMPVVFTIPSCLTFFEHDNSIWTFLSSIMIAQQGWNTTREDQRQLWKNVQRMLRMEGIEDVFEEKLQNDMKTYLAADTVATLFDWNNLQGMNLPTLW